MNTQDKLYSVWVRLEKSIRIMVKAENFDHAVEKTKAEYPNCEITSINLEDNLNLI